MSEAEIGRAFILPKRFFCTDNTPPHRGKRLRIERITEMIHFLRNLFAMLATICLKRFNLNDDAKLPMKSVSGIFLICLTLLLTGCSPEGEESVGPQPAPTITPGPPGETEVAEIIPSETMKPEKEKVPLSPFDAKQMAENLKDAGAPYAHIQNGVLTKVIFFKSIKPVTDETIKLLVDEHGRTPAHLAYLNLYGANLTDESLTIIARIPSLESLSLSHERTLRTNITTR